MCFTRIKEQYGRMSAILTYSKLKHNFSFGSYSLFSIIVLYTIRMVDFVFPNSWE